MGFQSTSIVPNIDLTPTSTAPLLKDGVTVYATDNFEPTESKRHGSPGSGAYRLVSPLHDCNASDSDDSELFCVLETDTCDLGFQSFNRTVSLKGTPRGEAAALNESQILCVT